MSDRSFAAVILFCCLAGMIFIVGNAVAVVLGLGMFVGGFVLGEWSQRRDR